MSERSYRNILLCVAGMTPQVITETLYALVCRNGERVDEIRVITTLAGRDRVKDRLLDPETGQYFAFCRDNGVDPATIRFDETGISLLHAADGRMLHDIRSAEDNEAAADQICRVVRELTRAPETRVHASVAGGRKTMGIYLTAAMQMFGRTQDRLSHVLVGEEFESHPDFYYVPPSPRTLERRDRDGKAYSQVSTADARIHLADIPFIRLRGVASAWLDKGAGSYGDTVLRAQEDLDLLESVHDVRIDLKAKRVMVANRSAALREGDLFVYALYAHLRQVRGDDCFVPADRITVDDLEAVFRHVTRARGYERPLEDWELVPRYGFLGTFARLVASGNPRDVESWKKRLGQARARIASRFGDAGIPERYAVGPLDGDARRHGLGLAPDRIVFVQ